MEGMIFHSGIGYNASTLFTGGKRFNPSCEFLEHFVDGAIKIDELIFELGKFGFPAGKMSDVRFQAKNVATTAVAMVHRSLAQFRKHGIRG